VVVARETTADDCGWIENTAKVSADNDTNTYNNTDTAKIEVKCQVAAPVCTADYWTSNPDQWCEEAKYKKLGDIFYLSDYGYKFGYTTLAEALNLDYDDTKLGAVKYLLREATAAYLSACSADVTYPLSTGEIVWKVWAALIDDYKYDILQLAKYLEELNAQTQCPTPYDGY
jgi:hypothetical protein